MVYRHVERCIVFLSCVGYWPVLLRSQTVKDVGNAACSFLIGTELIRACLTSVGSVMLVVVSFGEFQRFIVLGK